MQVSPAQPPEDSPPSHPKSAEELRADNAQLRELIVELSSIVARHDNQRR